MVDGEKCLRSFETQRHLYIRGYSSHNSKDNPDTWRMQCQSITSRKINNSWYISKICQHSNCWKNNSEAFITTIHTVKFHPFMHAFDSKCVVFSIKIIHVNKQNGRLTPYQKIPPMHHRTKLVCNGINFINILNIKQSKFSKHKSS